MSYSNWLQSCPWPGNDKDVLHASGMLCNDIFLDPVIEVKAVTFHELELSEVFSDSGKVLGYRAKVILDV